MKRTWIFLIALSFSFTSQGKSQHELACINDSHASSCGLAGLDYLHGTSGTRQSTSKALNLLEKGCSLFDGRSCDGLGLLYANPNLGLTDFEKAKKYFFTAIDLNYPRAYAHLGLILETGKYEKVDLPTCEKYYKKACNLNDSLGCNRLATLKYFGKNKSLSEAYKYWEKGCRLGDGLSCLNVGQGYSKGEFYKKSDVLAYQFLEKACDLGDGLACYRVGNAYETGRPLPTDLAKAKKYLDKACLLNNVLGCTAFAQHLLTHSKDQTNFAKNILLSACKKHDDGFACRILGNGFKQGTFGIPDLKKSLEIFEYGCSRKDAYSCNASALAYSSGMGTEADKNKALTLWQRSCDLGDGAACANLAATIQHEDPTKAFLMFQKGCDLSWGPSCSSAGIAAMEGLGTQRNLQIGFAMFQEACNLNASEGCYNLGQAYRMGAGTSVSIEEAKSTYMKACSLEHFPACFNLGTMFLVDKNYQKARVYLELACRNKHAGACQNLGMLYKDGHGVTRNLSKATELFNKACKIDHFMCLKPALILASGKHTNKDFVKILALMESSCERNNPLACMLAGEIHNVGLGTAINASKGTKLLQKACHLKLVEACDPKIQSLTQKDVLQSFEGLKP